MLHKSIRWRLQVWHTLLLICLVTGMLGAFYGYERAERIRAVDSQLQGLLTPLLPSVTPPEGMDRRPPPEFDRGPENGDENRPGRRPTRRNQPAFAEFESGAFYYTAFTRGGNVLAKSSAAPVIPPPSRGDDSKAQFFRNREQYRELLYFGPDDTCVIVGTSTAQLAGELSKLAWTLVGVGLGLTVFGFTGGWWVAGHALRPIGEISRTAKQIADGNRARRIEVGETESELGQLAGVLNRTFDELDRVFEQQVRFIADASHELRTPVSVILTQAQLALSRERGGEEYRESLKICQRAAERMRLLVNSLLELARVDSGEFAVKLEDCDLATLASESIDLIMPLAAEKNIVLRKFVQPVRAHVDPMKIQQVLVNLLSNAIQHNGYGIEVVLHVESTETHAVLQVADTGEGIPAQSLPHIFERFYRADPSRVNATGGSGLGLAISKVIVEAHGGTIAAKSETGKGTVFIVTLPLVR